MLQNRHRAWQTVVMRVQSTPCPNTPECRKGRFVDSPPHRPEGQKHARLPIVAIVDVPTSASSTLFNRLVGRKLALVDDRPGVTRDRREGDASLLAWISG